MAEKLSNENKLYTIAEVAQMSDLNPRSLSRWLKNGELDHFVTMYQDSTGHVFCRLGDPLPTDVLVDGSSICYRLLTGGEHG